MGFDIIAPKVACLGLEEALSKNFIDVSAWAWDLVVGAPGGLEQKVDEGNIAKWTTGAVRALSWLAAGAYLG